MGRDGVMNSQVRVWMCVHSVSTFHQACLCVGLTRNRNRNHSLTLIDIAHSIAKKIVAPKASIDSLVKDSHELFLMIGFSVVVVHVQPFVIL